MDKELLQFRWGEEIFRPCLGVQQNIRAMDSRRVSVRRRGLTIAQVSDMHVGRFTSGQVLEEMVRTVNRALAQHQLSAAGAEQIVTLMRRFDTVLGLLAAEQSPLARDVEVLMEERQRARQARDFARADTLRAQLRERGYVVEDTPQGPRLKRL